MISVIMSTYNEAIDYLRLSVESILNQTYRDLEFLVAIDNPDRMDIIEFIKGEAKKDARIKYYINKTNIGLTASLNMLLGKARGQYVARMDADDISLPTRLEKQVALMTEKDLDIVGCFIRNIDERSNEMTSDCTRYPKTDGKIKKYLKMDSAIPHPTWCAKKDMLLEYGYIDFRACEDYELLTRLALDGRRMGNVDEVLLLYRINDAGISRTKKIQQRLSKLYIRNNYANNKVSDYSDYVEYINGRDGKKEEAKLNYFYAMRARISKAKKDRRIARMLGLLCKMFFTSEYARVSVANEIKKRLLLV